MTGALASDATSLVYSPLNTIPEVRNTRVLRLSLGNYCQYSAYNILIRLLKEYAKLHFERMFTNVT